MKKLFFLLLVVIIFSVISSDQKITGKFEVTLGIWLNNEPIDDHTTTGRVVDIYNAGMTISQFIPVYSDDTDFGELKICDSDFDIACIGITFEAGSDGVGCAIVTSGLLRDDSWSWTPGKTIWVSDSGTLTETKETITDNFVIYIGEAVTATCIDIRLCPVTVKIATL